MAASAMPMPAMPAPLAEDSTCFYVTKHAADRLRERLKLHRLKMPQALLYCETIGFDRPVWAIPLEGSDESGFMIGRWEKARAAASGVHRFNRRVVGVTVVTKEQFVRSRWEVVEVVSVNAVCVMNETFDE